MALTQLDPRTALIVVDLQNAVVAMPTASPTAAVVANSATLAASFRARGLPVVLVRATGRAPGRTEQVRAASATPSPDATELVPELDRQLSDLVVTKQTWGAFTLTDLDVRLRALGVTQVVLTGVATTAGVESTARQAYELGYHVTLATDAMTDMSAEAHANSVTRIFPRLGETGTTAEILDLLDTSHG